MLQRRIIRTPKAPIPKVPSSQAFVVNNQIFCSGQIAIDPVTNELIIGDLAAQTAKALENLKNVIQEAGGSLKDVVKTTAYLVDLSLVNEFNDVYRNFFSEPYPPRTVIGVSRLARNALVEIEAIAILPKS